MSADATECLRAARDFALAASQLAEAAARRARSRGRRESWQLSQSLSVSLAKSTQSLSERLRSRGPRTDDEQAALDAICLAGDVIRLCQDALEPIGAPPGGVRSAE